MPIQRLPIIARYAIITLTPALLLIIGAALGGYWPLAALVWLTLLAAGLDQVLPEPSPDPDADIWAERLSIVLAIAHLALITVVLAGLDNGRLSPGAQLALFVATASFMGQVSHPNAHDLIHRKDRRLRLLGAAVYTSVFYGHHVSAHRMVHHAHVGTSNDPATPQPGEGFWSYVERAWPGNFRAGLEAETERLARKGQGPWSAGNPYLGWIGGAVVMALFVLWMAGLLGLVVFAALAFLVHLQILLSDYIQHYGLQRLRLPGGRVEPVGPHHSWNAPNGFSALLMLNAPRHSEHHLHPDRPYNTLSKDDGPRLPYPMPIMAMIALVPSAWRNLMDRRALKVMEAARQRLGPEDETPTQTGDLRSALIG